MTSKRDRQTIFNPSSLGAASTNRHCCHVKHLIYLLFLFLFLSFFPVLAELLRFFQCFLPSSPLFVLQTVAAIFAAAACAFNVVCVLFFDSYLGQSQKCLLLPVASFKSAALLFPTRKRDGYAVRKTTLCLCLSLLSSDTPTRELGRSPDHCIVSRVKLFAYESPGFFPINF